MFSSQKVFLKNISFTLISNIISILISTLAILIVPKIVGVRMYGYWQLFLFYSSYVGFLHFGWADGIYLQLGGQKYDTLDRKKINSQFLLFFIFQVLLFVAIAIITVLWINKQDIQFVLLMAGFFMIIINTRQIIQFVLQATNKLFENSIILIIDRIIYIVLILGCLLLGYRDYKLLVILDIISRFISLVYSFYCTRTIIFGGFANLWESLEESYTNIRIGSKLMFSTIASMLTVGIVRFSIERNWDVETFGKVSLALSISNLLLIFINAIGMILFPLLRRLNGSLLPNLYVSIRNILISLMFGYLLLYWPVRFVFLEWLPQYSESTIFIAILFPISIYESEMAILSATYLKTLREEGSLLKINVVSLLISVVIALFTSFFLRSLTMSIGSITFVSLFRCILSNLFLAKKLNIKFNPVLIIEIGLSALFIILAIGSNTGANALIYLIAYIIYLMFNSREIMTAIQFIKNLMIQYPKETDTEVII